MLPFLLETQEKRAIASLFTDELARIPEFSAGEARAIAVCPCKRISNQYDGRLFSPKDPADWVIQVALGGGFILPATGTWPITYGANSSASVISNAPTADEISTILNALASIVSAGGVVVTGAEGFFAFTFNNVGARTMLSGEPGYLVPLSLLTFERIVTGDADTREVQILRITQNVGAYATLSTATSAAAVAFSLIQAGDATHNAKWRITLPQDRYAGYWTFTLPSAGATSDPVGWDDNAAELQDVFQALYGSGNVLVRRETDDTFTAEFIGSRSHTAITIVSTTDASALRIVLFKSGLLDLRTTGIESLLNGSDVTMAKFEVQTADATGYPEKSLIRDVLLRRPVLTADMTSPTVRGELSGSNTDLSVSTTGTTDIEGQPGFLQWFQLFTVAAGAGAYTRKITIDRTDKEPHEGAIFRIELDVAASANPTVEIRDNTAAGTLLQTVSGDSSNATYFIFEARYDGSVWKKLSGRYET